MTDPLTDLGIDISGGSGFKGAGPVTFTPQTFISTTNPAGSDYFANVPATELWQITYAEVVLVTDATIPAPNGVRSPYLMINNSLGQDRYYVPPQWGAQVQSQTFRWQWLLGWNHDTQVNQPTTNGILTQASNLPDKMFVDGGEVFFIKCFNLQPGDQFTTVRYQYRKFQSRAKKFTIL